MLEETLRKRQHCVGPIRLKTTFLESCASLRRLRSWDHSIHMQLFRHLNLLIDISSWSQSVGFLMDVLSFQSISCLNRAGGRCGTLKGTRSWFRLSLGYLFCGFCHAAPGVCIGTISGSASWLAREGFSSSRQILKRTNCQPKVLLVGPLVAVLYIP
jgi:hypothetical protein